MTTKIKVTGNKTILTECNKTELSTLKKRIEYMKRSYEEIDKLIGYMQEYPDMPIEKLIRISTGNSPRIYRNTKKEKVYIYNNIKVYEKTKERKPRKKLSQYN